MAARTRFNASSCGCDPPATSVLAANFVWLGVGVVYAIAKERWSPTRAIYFAVSSLSGGAAGHPARVEGLADARSWACGVWWECLSLPRRAWTSTVQTIGTLFASATARTAEVRTLRALVTA